jgi:hypothetical protein
MIFGNAHGAFDLGAESEFVGEKLYALSEALGRRNPGAQHYGLLGSEYGYGQEFENEVFEMHPYWWGDCTCGFAELEEKKWGEELQHASHCFYERYPAERERWLDELITSGFDPEQESSPSSQEIAHMTAWSKANGYADAPQGMAVHCDCGVEAAYQEWRKAHDHAPDCRIVLPNFRCGDVELHWYKSIQRGLSVNRPVTHAELVAMFDRCFASLPSLETK